MQTLDRDEVSVRVDASPEAVYALVSDVTRTPEYSPEVVRCRWLDGATGPVVGARFEAVNKVPRRPSWKNRPVVTAAEPGRVFAFRRGDRIGGTIEWCYRMEPAGDGTRLTESYEVIEPVSRLGWFIMDTLYGRKDRRAELREGMRQTLERIAAVAQQSPAR